MVLDHGNIIERGSHDELIAQKGEYSYTGAVEHRPAKTALDYRVEDHPVVGVRFSMLRAVCWRRIANIGGEKGTFELLFFYKGGDIRDVEGWPRRPLFSVGAENC